MPAPLIRAILVEDHPLLRMGLKMALAAMAEISVVAEVEDGLLAVAKSIELRPDLVLMDIQLPGIDGIEATRQIKNALSTKVILITSHDNDEYLFAGLAAGADAYCLRAITNSQLASCVRSVMEGAVWLDPGIAKPVLDRAIAANARAQVEQGNIFGLSERELEILALVVEGLSNQQIAQRICVSQETVKTHLRHIMEKLSVSDRTQAAVKAIRHGVVK